MNKLDILVLCGGRSAERLVSVVSAKFVVESLDPRRYRASLIFIDPAGRWLHGDPRRLKPRVSGGEPDLANGARPLDPWLALRRADAVFPVLHGPLGEDGTVQGLLEVAGVPYVGCGVLGSAAGMDKEATKVLAQEAGLPLLPWAAARSRAEAAAAARRLGWPLFVKPARMGSSVGVSKVKGPRDLPGAVAAALRYDDKLILEKGITAREIETAVLGDPWAPASDPLALKASICGEIAPNAEFYTYASKYLDPEGAKLMIPAPIAAATGRLVRALALKAFRALDCYAMARADFLMDRRTGRVFFNELNTIPGFTSASMYPLLWQASGLRPAALLDRLIALALRRHKARGRLKVAP